MHRRIIIGVIGGNWVPKAVAMDAREVGAEIAIQQQILLTGGKYVDDDQVKNAAIYGAKHARHRGGTARIIGILPSESRKWGENRQSCSFFLATGLTSAQRDAINGTTPDVAIVFPGGHGTLCELAFALLAKKPVLYWNAVGALRNQLGNATVDHHLEDALLASRTKLVAVCGITEGTDAQMLLSSLKAGLQAGNDFSGNITQLVERAVKLAGSIGPETTFPGFQGEPHSKSRFDQIVQRMSHCP